MSAAFEAVAQREVEVRVVTRYRVVNPVTGTVYAEGARTWSDAAAWKLAQPGLIGTVVEPYEEVI